MNYKLIMLPNPVLVSDERIKVGDSYHTSDYRIVKWLQELEDFSEGASSYHKPIIAGIEGLPKLDLSAIEIGWVDVEKLAYKQLPIIPTFDKGEIINSDTNFFIRLSWIDGFKAAQSLNEKKYSEEELKDALFYALSIKSETCCTTNTKDSTVRSTIKSLSKPKEYNVEVDMEDKIAMDGHTLIGRKPKITNNTIKVSKILD